MGRGSLIISFENVPLQRDVSQSSPFSVTQNSKITESAFFRDLLKAPRTVRLSYSFQVSIKGWRDGPAKWRGRTDSHEVFRTSSKCLQFSRTCSVHGTRSFISVNWRSVACLGLLVSQGPCVVNIRLYFMWRTARLLFVCFMNNIIRRLF